jgi:tetratricopeptide (TPR) repeat protein
MHGKKTPPMNPRPGGSTATWAIAIALVAAVAGVYAPVARHPFIGFDDDVYIYENPPVKAGLSWAGVIWAFTRFHASNWHPLTWLSHMLDCQWFGATDGSAGAHHLVSVVFHAANAALLFVALRRITGATRPSGFVAGLFAVHPLRVESVAWACERKDVLSGFFFMLTLLAYAGYARRPGGARYLLVCLGHLAGLLAKPMLVSLPFVLLALDVWPLRRWRWGSPSGRPEPSEHARLPGRRLLLEKLPLFALSIGAGVATIAAQSGGGAVAQVEEIPWAWRLVVTPVAYVNYLWKTLWPTGLAVFYPHPTTTGTAIRDWIAPSLLCGLLLVAVTAAVVAQARRRPHLLAGWLWYSIMLAPVIGLLQVGDQAWADRYAYLPTIGFYLMIVWSIREWVAGNARLRRIAVAAAAVVLAALAIAARVQVERWRDSATLYEHTLRVTRDNWLIHSNLGVTLAGRGELAQARHHFEEAVRIRPDFIDARSNLCTGAVLEGRFEEAREHCERTLALSPDRASAHFGLGMVFQHDGDLARSRASFERALRSRPDYPEARVNLGLVLSREGKAAEARDQFEEALRRRPGYLGAEIALARLLALCPFPSVRDTSKALTIAREAVRRTDERDHGALAALAVACAAAGRYAEAVDWQIRALELAPETSKPRARMALERYRAGRPLIDAP